MIVNQVQQPRVCYIHKESTNQSFLDMHYYLQSINIVNNDFFLALLDTGLAGVDPFDPFLSREMKSRVSAECYRNYWYFLREVVRIPKEGGKANGGARYRLDRGSLAMNYMFILNFNLFVELPRQHGKTTTALCRYLWDYQFGTTNSQIMFMHKAHQGSKKNLKTLKKLRDALPSYLQMSAPIGINGERLKIPDTVVNIEHPINHNSIVTFASARNKESADNLGRGLTFPLQYYDEFAFMPYNKTVYLAATPAFSTASKNARDNGAPYGILITTTPGDLLTDSGKFAYSIKDKATPFNEAFYDMEFKDLVDIRDANNRSNFFHIRFTYQQLGSGQEYFKQMVIDMEENWPEIRREVMLEWAETSNECPFNQEDLDIIKNYLKPPIRTILFGKFRQYQFQVYEDMMPDTIPIIGVDVSGADYQDSSAITVVDSKTTRVTACFNCNFIPGDDLASMIYELVTRYMPNAVVNIELNGGFGKSVMKRLVKTKIKPNLYYEIKDKVMEEVYNGVRMNKVKQKVKVYGLTSTKDIRHRLIEILFERVRYHKDKFISEIIYNEMRAMEQKKNGKIEHSSNSHDDQVFSYLMAMYVWYDGHNLADNWRIQKNTLKTDENLEIEELAYEDEIEEKGHMDVDFLSYDEDENSEVAKALEWIEKNSKFVTTEDVEERYMEEQKALRNFIFANNEDAKISYAMQHDMDPDSINVDMSTGSFVKLPDSIFMDSDELSDLYNEEENYFGIFDNPMGDTYDRSKVLKGNLSHFWDRV